MLIMIAFITFIRTTTFVNHDCNDGDFDEHDHVILGSMIVVVAQGRKCAQ